MKLPATLLLTVLAATSLLSQTLKPAPTAPDKETIATVLGDTITGKDSHQMVALIFRPLLDRFAEANKLEPTRGELDTFVFKMSGKQRENLVEMEQQKKQLLGELKSPSLTTEERAQKESSLKMIENLTRSFQEMEKKKKGGSAEFREQELESARNFVKSWKVNRALHRKYGGRVIFQQMGPEPLDAFRDFLKEQEKKGAFRIIDTTYTESFWRYFTNDKMHSFYPGEEGDKLMNTPWWLMEKPLNK